MRLAAIDQMISYALSELASEDNRRTSALVRGLAEQWPNEPALAVSFALTSAAASLDDVMLDQEATTRLAYQLAALVASDVLALEAMGQSPAKGHDLLHFWRRVDPYFLNAAEPTAR